ncbi:MAG: eukaryotic translation initiation factor 3 subunit, partial [Olpidium bornovanus]
LFREHCTGGVCVGGSPAGGTGSACGGRVAGHPVVQATRRTQASIATATACNTLKGDRGLLLNPRRSLTQIKFNRDGDLLFSASKDNVLCVWYWHNGERLGTYEGHQGAIWSVQTGRLVHTWQFPTAVKWVAFSTDGRHAFLTCERRMGYPGSITILEIKPLGGERESLGFGAKNLDQLGRLRFPLGFPENPEPVSMMQPKESKALVGGWGPFDQFVIAGHEDGTITHGDLLNTVKHHSALITDIQFAKDHSYFITASKDSSAHIYEAKTLHLLKTYKPADKTPLNSAALTPSPAELVVLGGGQEAMEAARTSQRAGKFECRFYNKIFEEEIGRVKGHFGPINTIAIHPAGTGYASGAEDGFIRLHQFDKGYQKFAAEAIFVE